MRMNLFVVEPSKMATFVRRVPFLVYIFVILTVKQCKSQDGLKGFKKDPNALNLNPNVIKPVANIGNENQNAIPGNYQPAGANQPGQFNVPVGQQGGLFQQNFQPVGGQVGQGQPGRLGGIKQQGGLRYEAGQPPLKLADHPDCAEDVDRICSKTMKRNNFAVLDCLQDRVEV